MSELVFFANFGVRHVASQRFVSRKSTLLYLFDHIIIFPQDHQLSLLKKFFLYKASGLNSHSHAGRLEVRPCHPSSLGIVLAFSALDGDTTAGLQLLDILLKVQAMRLATLADVVGFLQPMLTHYAELEQPHCSASHTTRYVSRALCPSSVAGCSGTICSWRERYKELKGKS